VLGQPEAVDCLVERLAMIKAGLTNPSRPLGVFLFVGPTGTGKTEIAKALAEYLFGSVGRMIRIDMSELQTPESLDRLLGNRGDGHGATSLVQEIRKQPFSVVLLDEFEKADPSIWDLFLQLFDDGRLTDRLGDTADFRHSIIIMTSNLGAARSASIGFSRAAMTLSPNVIQRVLEETFRPEFLNRIDRIVTFQALGPAVMRELLNKELSDQFLFVRGECDRLAVEFVDPDALDDFPPEPRFPGDRRKPTTAARGNRPRRRWNPGRSGRPRNRVPAPPRDHRCQRVADPQAG
jgi:ATP-dependent Clp protease ATP-binding subunit ClpC